MALLMYCSMLNADNTTADGCFSSDKTKLDTDKLLTARYHCAIISYRTGFKKTRVFLISPTQCVFWVLLGFLDKQEKKQVK